MHLIIFFKTRKHELITIISVIKITKHGESWMILRVARYNAAEILFQKREFQDRDIWIVIINQLWMSQPQNNGSSCHLCTLLMWLRVQFMTQLYFPLFFEIKSSVEFYPILKEKSHETIRQENHATKLIIWSQYVSHFTEPKSGLVIWSGFVRTLMFLQCGTLSKTLCLFQNS